MLSLAIAKSSSSPHGALQQARRVVFAGAGLLLCASVVQSQPVSVAARAELAPTGTLRVGINYGNVILARRDEASGALRGVHVDLVLELGRRAGVPVELVGYAAAAPMVNALAVGRLDVALMSADPARTEVAFSPAFGTIDATYLVPAGSSVHTIDEIDRDGRRIAVADQSAYDFFLRRTLRHAELVRAPSTHEALALFVNGRLDALVGLRPRLLEDGITLPGSRVLDGAFMTIEQTIASPQGRVAAARYLRHFVEEATASGLVTRLLEAHAVRGVLAGSRTPAR